jgi:hypothetical protein
MHRSHFPIFARFMPLPGVPALWLVIGAVSLTGPSAAAAAPVTLSVSSPTTGVSQEVVVPIRIKGAAAVGAVEMDLTYDPAVLQAGLVDKGEAASSTLLEVNAIGSGRIRMALVSQDGLSGDGAIVNAHFLVRADASEKTGLNLQHVRVWTIDKSNPSSPRLVDALVKTEPGEVVIAGGWPLWMAAALAVGAGLLVALIVVMRKRKRPRRRAPAQSSRPVVQPPPRRKRDVSHV